MSLYRDIAALLTNSDNSRLAAEVTLGGSIKTNLAGKFIFCEGDGVQPSEHNGWKFHLSVDKRDLDEAFEVVMETALRHDKTLLKVAMPDMAERLADHSLANSQRVQAGKIFTVYDTGRSNFLDFISDIEKAFLARGIRPGPQVWGDMPMPGKGYSFYRYDRDSEGNYVLGTQQADDSVPDPYKGKYLTSVSKADFLGFTAGSSIPASWRKPVPNDMMGETPDAEDRRYAYLAAMRSFGINVRMEPRQLVIQDDHKGSLTTFTNLYYRIPLAERLAAETRIAGAEVSR